MSINPMIGTHAASRLAVTVVLIETPQTALGIIKVI